MHKSSLLILGGLLTAALANASIIASLTTGPINLGGGNYAYNYTASLTSDERMDPTQTSGNTCPGPGLTLVACVPPGTFFTIYDIPAYVSSSVTAANWG